MVAPRSVARRSVGPPPRNPQERETLPPSTSRGPAPAITDSERPTELRAAVASALLAYSEQQQSSPHTPAVEFTPNSAANELIRGDPFAFLTGVLFDQGIPAERAWLAPYLLLQRLGSINPIHIAADLEAVRTAVASPPTLHRYIDKMPTWLVLAAKRVISDYACDAGAIWSDSPSADKLQKRFEAFTGIGQKKAAMAVEILERDLGVRVENLDRSDIAYDVHLRRVFLRTRIADRDDREHMIAVARQLNPVRPGALDLPAWLIGRGWCHPGIPDCGHCPLTRVCPKDIERAARVKSG